MSFEPLVLLQHGTEKLLQLKGQRDGQGNLTPHLDKTRQFTLKSQHDFANGQGVEWVDHLP